MRVKMKSIRKFLIRHDGLFFYAASLFILLLCLAILFMNGQAREEIIGLVLLALSMWMRGKKGQRQTISCLILGVSIYFFPATAAAALFCVGDTFRIRAGRWKSLLIPAGAYICGMPGVVSTGQISYPVHRFVSWLNVDNLFDHNISFWSLVTGREQLRFGLIAAAVFVGLCMLGFFFYVENRSDQAFFMIWSVWTWLLFLPYGHAEDGMVLLMLFFFCKPKLEERRIYRGSMLLWLMESLMMIGSAYGGYEQFGYDFYQLAVGMNFVAWLVFSYKGTEYLWKKDRNTAPN